MKNTKLAILVGGPMDGVRMQIQASLHGYLEAPRPPTIKLDAFIKPSARPEDSIVHTVTYKEMTDGTHWVYWRG